MYNETFTICKTNVTNYNKTEKFESLNVVGILVQLSFVSLSICRYVCFLVFSNLGTLSFNKSC